MTVAPTRVRVRRAELPARPMVAASSSRLADPPRPRIDVALRAAVVVAAVGFIATYLAVAFARFRYPFELEWMEGGVLGHVQRVLDGRPLYPAPSLRFTPFLYTPLYYYVSAGAGWLFGARLSTLRIVSILSSIVALGAVARLVWIETRSMWASVAAAGLLAACFRLGGAWFDLARVDSLFLGLLFVGLVCVRSAKTPRAAMLAGVVLAAAFLAKQSALLPSLAVLPFLWRRDWRLAAWYGGGLAAVLGTTTLWFNHLSGGWYGQYTLHLAGQHAIATDEYVTFWTRDLIRPLGVAIILGGVGLWRLRRREEGWFWLPVTVGLLAASYTARLHTGGYDNVLLPAFGAVALVAALGLHALVADRDAPRRPVGTRLVLVAAVAMFATLAYNPLRQLPSAATTGAGQRLVADLRGLPQPLYIPGDSWFYAVTHGGEQTNAHAAAIEDVLRGHLRGSNQTLARELRDAVIHQRFRVIVSDAPAVFSYLPSILDRYYCVTRVIPARDRPAPVTGTVTGPGAIWVPRTAALPRTPTTARCPR